MEIRIGLIGREREASCGDCDRVGDGVGLWSNHDGVRADFT